MSTSVQFFAVSGHTSGELTELAESLAAKLRDHADLALVDVAHTLRVARPQAHTRWTTLAHDRQDLIDRLISPTVVGPPIVCSRIDRPVTFLLPGLGNHHADMGRDLYRDEPVYRASVDRCAELLQPHLGMDIRTALYVPPPSVPSASGEQPHTTGPDLRTMLGRRPIHETESGGTLGELRRTLIAQPALFVVEYALVEWCRAHGIVPAAMLGFSIGEYVAAQHAGIFSLEDALRLVAARARLIDALPPGAMLAVALPEADLRSRLGDRVWVSAASGDDLSVVAGTPDAIDDLAIALAADSIAAHALPTTHAFHTPFMRPIDRDFRRVLSDIDLRPPAIPIVSGLTGTFMTDVEATSPDYWVEHTCRPVRFADAVALLRRTGHDLFLELGPGAALSSLVLGLEPRGSGEPPSVIAAMRHQSDRRSDTYALQKAASALWIAGGRVDWEAFGAQYGARRAPLAFGRFERPSPTIERAAQTPAAMPTDAQAILQRLWGQVLKTPHIDSTRTFFEQGGNSLKATQLIFRIHKNFGVDLPLRIIYEAPTLSALARVVETQRGERDAAPTSNTDGEAAGDRGSRPESYRLPNGLSIQCHNPAEVAHFYEDIFVNRAYLRHGLTLPSGSTVFDVGANVGMFALFVHATCANARLFAFEPAPPLFELLRANLATHDVAARVFPCALSRQAGRGRLTFYPNSSGMSSLYADPAEERLVLEAILANQVKRGEADVASLLAHADDYFAERLRRKEFECPLSTVSDVMAAEGVSSLDLLKIDVQKSEFDVLLGIADADWPCIRQIVAEVHDVDGRVHEVTQLLADRGYEIVVEQEALYAGSSMHNVYARRKGA